MWIVDSVWILVVVDVPGISDGEPDGVLDAVSALPLVNVVDSLLVAQQVLGLLRDAHRVAAATQIVVAARGVAHLLV